MPLPSELAWLDVFSNIDIAEFVEELAQTLTAVTAGAREASDLDALLHEWYRSAIVLQDAALQRRFAEARDLLTR